MNTQKWAEIRRKNTDSPSPAPSLLPVDYLKLVQDALETALESPIKEVRKIFPDSYFYLQGALFPDETLLTVSFHLSPESVQATTLYASSDFATVAPAPGTLEKNLAACVDAAGYLLDYFLDPAEEERRDQFLSTTLGAIEDAPFEWTEIKVDGPEKIFVKMDKANLRLESLTDDWLAKNDPSFTTTNQAQADVQVDNAEDFLRERLEAIQKVSSSSGGNRLH